MKRWAPEDPFHVIFLSSEGADVGITGCKQSPPFLVLCWKDGLLARTQAEAGEGGVFLSCKWAELGLFLNATRGLREGHFLQNKWVSGTAGPCSQVCFWTRVQFQAFFAANT